MGRWFSKSCLLRSKQPAGCTGWGVSLSSKQREGALPTTDVLHFSTRPVGGVQTGFRFHLPPCLDTPVQHTKSKLYLAALPRKTGEPHAHWPVQAHAHRTHWPRTAAQSWLAAGRHRPHRVTFCLLLAPLEQSVALRAAVLPGQGGQRVSSFHTEFALWPQAPAGRAQQSGASKAQGRGSAQ